MRPNQANCAASAIFFLTRYVNLLFLSLSPTAAAGQSWFLYQSDGHLCLDSQGQREREGGRGGGTTRCPCWQRCIKTGMSHPICRAHLTASKGGSSEPLYSPSLQSAPSFPCLLPLCLSPYSASPSVGSGGGGSAKQHHTGSTLTLTPIERKHGVYKYDLPLIILTTTHVFYVASYFILSSILP